MAFEQVGPSQIPLGAPASFSEIIIDGETYIPSPHEVNPELPEYLVWNQWPPDNLFISDPNWYDSLGHDPIYQRRIWANSNEQGQLDQFRQLLHKRPDRGLDLMFAAAVKGRGYVIKFLLEQGVRATANEAEGDEGSLIPLHAAAYQGHLDCVKVLMNDGKLGPNIVDDMGGTPLMRASWGKHPEVVQHLLEVGADITIRQRSPDDDPGTNAFEFACGSGCLKCAETILACAVSLGVEPADFVTRMALAAAAASNCPDMLAFAVEHGGYPMLNDNGASERPIELTLDQKSALEHAFDKSLLQPAHKALQPLFLYLNSQNMESIPNLPSLSDTIVDSLIHAILSLSSQSSPEVLDAFTFIHNLIFAKDSRFTNPTAVEGRSRILGDAFFWAAQHGQLGMLQHIYSMYPEINVNHLSHTMKPIGSTALYTATGTGKADIVHWLFATLGAVLDVHKGIGKFVNGPTALWITFSNGHANTAKLLLEHGGPVEEVLGRFDQQRKDHYDVVVSAAKAYRSPVILWSEEAWREQQGDPSKKGNGEAIDKDGNEMKYLVLEVSVEDAGWLAEVQVRHNDEDLLAADKSGRELKEKPAYHNTSNP